MRCPRCGYVLDVYDFQCPRCIRLAEKAAKPVPAPAPAPKLKSKQKARETRGVVVAERVQPSLEDDLDQFRIDSLIQPPKEINELELGWPLTIALCLFIGLNALEIVLLYQAGNIALLVSAIFRIAGAFGLLSCQRWGFCVLAIFSIFPTLLTLIAKLFHPLEIFLGVIPALAIIMLTLKRWDRLD